MGGLRRGFVLTVYVLGFKAFKRLSGDLCLCGRLMAGSIAVLADRDTATMFRLVGIRNSFAVEEPEKGRELLASLARDEKYALVMITYALAAAMESLIATIAERQERPLIAVIPSRERPISERIAPIRELIRRVVGVEVKMAKQPTR